MPRPKEDSTPWQVICPQHGPTALTREEYIAQMMKPDSLWQCPICLSPSQWDDDNHEVHGG